MPTEPPRHLLLLRHADAEAFRPGAADRDRRLTPDGAAQAAAVGVRIREQGFVLDRALCSPAVRARQTLDGLGLGAPGEVIPALYNASVGDLLEAIAEVPDDVRGLLVVAHAPGVPDLAWELAEPAASDPAALARLGRGFTPATLAVLRVPGTWADPSGAVLESVL